MLPWGYMATEDIQRASSKFILSCYGLSACADLTEARVRSWERKMGRNVLEPPKLKSLPPTVEAFNQNVQRAHLAASIMKGSLNPDPNHYLQRTMDGTLLQAMICFSLKSPQKAQ